MLTLTQLLLPAIIFLFSCNSNETKPESININHENSADSNIINYPKFEPLDRSEIIKTLQSKISNNDPFIVHVFVPLCDNDNQGIVPVNASLGNGRNLKTNLYWGALYGVKTHLKNNGWKSIHEEINISDIVLERIVLEKTLSASTKIILVADAYAGDKMQECLHDFFAALAETKVDSFKINDTTFLNLNTTDLVAFTGHNGLMDSQVAETINKKAKQKDAIVLACISYDYFLNRLNYVNAYPLITTRQLMAPEAYVLNAAIISWAKMENEINILNNASSAYSQYQKCSLSAAKNIFKSGY